MARARSHVGSLRGGKKVEKNKSGADGLTFRGWQEKLEQNFADNNYYLPWRASPPLEVKDGSPHIVCNQHLELTRAFPNDTPNQALVYCCQATATLAQM